MEALPKIVRQRLQSSAKPEVHPQSDLLTAFVEKLLSEPERVQVMKHMAQCEDCREWLFLSTPQQAPVQGVGKIPSRAGWLSWPVLRWGAAVACVVVVGTAVTLRHQSPNRSALSEKAVNGKAQGMATFTAPAEAVAPAANGNPSAEIRYKVARPRKDADEDKLVAKLEAPPRPSPKAMTATPQFQIQFDRSRQHNANEVGSAGAIGGDSGAAWKMPTPAPAMTAKGANLQAQSENGKKQAQAAASRNFVNVPAASEMVEVEPGPPQTVESADAAVAKSKDASQTQLPVNGREVSSLQTMASPAATAAATKRDFAYSTNKELDRASKLAPRWMLTPGGVLQRSWDAGKSWETVSVVSKGPFQTFAAVVAEIWVGGANGVLYHSSDAGLHWVQVIPKADGDSLTSGIVRIEFSDAQNGKLTTVNGETWTTSDAGQTWQKN